MIDHCLNCPIRLNCDFLSGMCRLAAGDVIKARPELVLPVRRSRGRPVTLSPDERKANKRKDYARYYKKHRGERLMYWKDRDALRRDERRATAGA